MNSYFMSDFKYFPLVSMFSNATSPKETKNLQQNRARRVLYNKYELEFQELLYKGSSSTMNVKRLCFLCVEIYES